MPQIPNSLPLPQNTLPASQIAMPDNMVNAFSLAAEFNTSVRKKRDNFPLTNALYGTKNYLESDGIERSVDSILIPKTNLEGDRDISKKPSLISRYAQLNSIGIDGEYVVPFGINGDGLSVSTISSDELEELYRSKEGIFTAVSPEAEKVPVNPASLLGAVALGSFGVFEGGSRPDRGLMSVSVSDIRQAVERRKGREARERSRKDAIARQAAIEAAELAATVGQNKKAQAFRRGKLRAGALGELIDTIPATAAMKAAITPMLKVRDRLREQTSSDIETHRDLAPLFAGLMTSSPELRRQTMEALDKSAWAESEALKAEMKEKRGTLEADFLILGGGLHGSVMATKLRAEHPDARIVVIDQQKKLGGQFRSYGERPVFYINSRTHRPQSDKSPLPGGDGNLNPLGTAAPLQVTDIAKETYPTNLDMGDPIAVNAYLSATPLLGVRAYEVSGRAQSVFMDDVETGKEYRATAPHIFVFSGIPRRTIFGFEDDGEETAEELFEHFAQAESNGNDYPMDKYAGKDIAILGGADTGKVAAGLLLRLGPSEAYNRSVSQLGGPNSVTMYGTNYTDRDGFCASNRPRYLPLASYIPELLTPVDAKGYISRVEDDETFLVRAEGRGGPEKKFDFVIDCTQAEDSLQKAENLFNNTDLRPISGTIAGEPTFIGLQVKGSNVYLGGPAAKLQLTSAERAKFADGIVENTASAWANVPRVEQLAALATAKQS